MNKSLLYVTLLIIFNLTNQLSEDFHLDEEVKSSLSDKSYKYYRIKLPELKSNTSQFLLFEARRNVDQDLLDNVFSDPNLYISLTEVYPGPTSNTWSSSRFGDEIISIDRKYVKSGAFFYVSIYCEFKCNFILDAKLYENYEFEEDKLYTLSMIPDDVIKITFKSRNNYELLKINCVSYKMKPFQIFLAKKEPSSSNTLPSNPIFLNGYYFTIKKGDKNYEVNHYYEVLIENKEYKQDLLFWITYDDEDTELSELSPLFGSVSANSANCFSFKIEKQYLNKAIIISTSLFNGNGFIRIGGWEKVKDMKIKSEDKNTYPIISDKSILLTKKEFKSYGKVSKDSDKDLHFCFIASEETSYIIKVYYKKHAEMAQTLNYLLPGIGSDDMLPGKTVTKYSLFNLEQNKDIKIELKIKSGNPRLYLYYTYDGNSYINSTTLDKMKKAGEIVIASKDSNQKYIIQISETENKCILNPIKDEEECEMFAVVNCESKKDCLYEIFFDHVGSQISMKPKVLYSNVIRAKEIDQYSIHITDESAQNLAIILSQNTGTCKLKLSKFITQNGEMPLQLQNTEKFNKDYMPNVIEIKSSNFPYQNIKGTFYIDVEGESFSSYSIYYYTFDESSSSKLDHKIISMSLIKGNIIQDYIKENHNIKVYSYDNSNVGNNKTDLFIYFQGSDYIDYRLYVFKNLNDYSFEKETVKGFIWESDFSNVIYIKKDDPKYIVGNLYIMVFGLRNNELYDDLDIVYRNEEPGDSPFLLAITDETTPLSLIEGVEFRQSLTIYRDHQSFYYSHRNMDEDFLLTINVPMSKAKIGLKLGEKDFIYEKIIKDNYFLKLESKDIKDYCPSSKSCNIEITMEAINLEDSPDMETYIILLCRSSLNSIIYLNRNSLIDKRKISDNEKQYFIVEANPAENTVLTINTIFTNGRGVLYAKKANISQQISQLDFPNEDNYQYTSNLNNNEELSIINIPYEDISNDLPCKILVTVKGQFQYLSRTQGEYTISISNIVDDIFPNKNYRLFIIKSQMKYYHFSVKGQKKRLSISMTNKEIDAFMYLNYGSMKRDATDFEWRSDGSYNEYIDISVEDPYFVSRKKKSLEGEYFLAIRALKDTYFNLFISDSDIKIMTITEEFPGTCTCENEGDYCYFRYENIISPDIAEVNKQELIFYFEFTYGAAQILASLYETGNNGFILNNLPSQYRKDFKSTFSNQYLRIELTPDTPKYTLDSVLVLATRCKTKSMFDFNVRPLWKSGDILAKYQNLIYLNMNMDNIFFISDSSSKPINLTLYSVKNSPLIIEARAISGSAEVHVYIYNSEESLNDEFTINKIKGYKHLSKFSVDERDRKSFYEMISSENSFRQNLFFEVKAKRDCLFSIHMHYNEDIMHIQMSKQEIGKFKDGKFYGYIELLPEYEEVILNIDKMTPDSQFSIYTKTNILSSSNFKNMMNYSAPSPNNFDTKARTQSFTPTLSIKIKNLPKELYSKGKKIITIFFIEAENEIANNDRLNMIAYANVDHYQRITPVPNKYIYSSLSSKQVDETVFSLKQQDIRDNLLVIEISSCRGNIGYTLTNSLSNQKKSNILQNYIMDEKGKKVVIAKIEKNTEYYLSVYGLKEDEMLFSDSDIKREEIDFLLYYYTTTDTEYNQTTFDSKLNYDLTGPGVVVLNLPNLETINIKNGKNKLDDLAVSVIITQNKNEYEYMNSICYLSRKYEYIEQQKLYINYTININKNKNKIEIKNLDRTKNYYINVLITNKKTGQIFALEPLQLKANKIISNNNIIATILVICIIILILIIIYFYRKYRLTKAIVNYESKDIKKIKSIPKSITELKMLQGEKNKKTKEKYNSLTEDSGQV